MAQYDVHSNTNEATRTNFPYLVEVQSDALDRTKRRVIIPLVAKETIRQTDQILHPIFEIDGDTFLLMPFDIAAVPAAHLGDVVGSLKAESDLIIGALDLLFARF